MMSKEDDSKTNKTVLVLKVPHDDSGEPSDVSDDAEKTAIEKNREVLFAAIKIITIATFIDDSADEYFFEDFGNYMAIVKRLSDIKILSDEITFEENKFYENPIDCWMKVIIAIFVALHSFPDNSGIYCDVLTSEEAKNNSERTIFGFYFSTLLRLEAYDWKDHKVDLYIPNKIGDRILFLVDNEPSLYTFLH